MKTLRDYFKKDSQPETRPIAVGCSGKTLNIAVSEKSRSLPHSPSFAELSSTSNAVQVNSVVTPSSSGKRKVLENRKFRDSWQTLFPFLQYVQNRNVMICEVCVDAGVSNLNEWVHGTMNFKKDAIIRHKNSKIHLDSLQVKVLQSDKERILEQVHKNSEGAIISLMKNTYWLCKENVAILKCTSLHELIDTQFKLAKHNVDIAVQYRSPTAAWEMIEIIAAMVEASVMNDIKKSLYFSIMVDESTDLSVTKHLVIYIKFLNPDTFCAETRYVKLLKMEKANALAILSAIKDFLNSKSLPLDKLIGWGSDGTNVMMGHNGGVEALLRKLCPKLIGIHDFGHAENLAAIKAYEGVPYLTNVDAVLKAVYSYFCRSAERLQNLKDVQHQLESDQVNMKKLYEIRWLARSEAVIAVVRNLEPLLCVFRNDERDPTANSLHKKLCEYKFLLHLHFVCDILKTLAILSKFLQSKNLHPQEAYPRINATIALLKDSCIKGNVLDDESVCKNFHAFYKTMKQHPLSLHGHVIHYKDKDENEFLNNVQKYITLLCECLENRFGDAKLHAVLKACKIFDPSTYPKKPNELQNFGLQELKILANHFIYGASSTILQSDMSQMTDNEGCSTDLPTPQELREGVFLEFPLFRHFIYINHANNSFSEVCSLMQRHVYKTQYPQLSKICAALSVIPSGSIDCERGFSQQNIIKSKYRNKLLTKHLDNLMQIRIEGPSMQFFDWQKAFQLWSRQFGKRQTILNPGKHLKKVTDVTSVPKIKRPRKKNKTLNVTVY